MVLFWIGSSGFFMEMWMWICDLIELYASGSMTQQGLALEDHSSNVSLLFLKNVRIAQGKSVRFSNGIWNLMLVDIKLLLIYNYTSLGKIYIVSLPGIYTCIYVHTRIYINTVFGKNFQWLLLYKSPSRGFFSFYIESLFPFLRKGSTKVWW